MERPMRPTLCALAAVTLSGVIGSPSSAAYVPRQVVMTALNEVQRGNVGGREFLTLSIVGLSVGPLACRGTVLTTDTSRLGDAPRRERIETAALSAMLNAESVTITVPLDDLQCVDGKPTFTDLWVLPAMP